MVERIISSASLTGGNGVASSVVSGRFSREEVIAEESLSRHDREVATSKRRPGVDEKEDDDGKVDDLLENRDGHEAKPDVLRSPDEDDEGQENDPRSHGDGPADVEAALVGKRLELQGLENVPEEPSSNKYTDDQNDDSRDRLVEVVDDGRIGSGIIPNEERQVEDSQERHEDQDNGSITLRNDVSGNGPSLRDEDHNKDDSEIHQHVQKIGESLQALNSNSVTLQGSEVDHVEQDRDELQDDSDRDQANNRVEGLRAEKLPGRVGMSSNNSQIEDEEGNVQTRHA